MVLMGGGMHLGLRAFAAIPGANVYVFMIILGGLDLFISLMLVLDTRTPAHSGHFLFIDLNFIRWAGSWSIKTCYIHLSRGSPDTVHMLPTKSYFAHARILFGGVF